MSSPWGTNDALILRVLKVRPDWFSERVLGRIEGHSDKDACWQWTGYLDPNKGYGRLYTPMVTALGLPSRSVIAHRVVWLALRGPVPARLVLDHDGPHGCSNKACVNPGHLQAVTNRHNVVLTGASFSAANHRKTHCPYGHPLNAGNLTPWTAKNGHRGCRTCEDARQATRARLVRNAAETLGLGWSDYIAVHGSGIRAARRILAMKAGN